jgi:hypothetical protein
MKHGREADEPSTPKYDAWVLTPDQKDMVSTLYLAWDERGWTQADFVTFFSEAGYLFDTQSLQRWVKQKRLGSSPISNVKSPGRPNTLNDEQWRILVGYVIFCNSAKVTVTPEDGQRFVWWLWRLKLHVNSVRNYFKKGCLSA